MNLYKAIVQIEVFYLGDDEPTGTDIERHVFEEAVINNFEIVSVGQIVSESITVDGIEGRTMRYLNVLDREFEPNEFDDDSKLAGE